MEKLKIVKGVPYLEVLTGPMFSGKSQEINRRLINIDYYNKHRIENYNGEDTVSYVVLRPSVDTRPDSIRAVPYSDKNWRFVPKDNIWSEDLIDFDYIIIDEAQFFTTDIIPQVLFLLQNNKYIIICGLDKDYRSEPFSEFMKWSLAASDEVTKLTAICSRCGSPATMMKLVLTNPEENLSDNVIIEDENHKYVSVCRKCFYSKED